MRLITWRATSCTSTYAFDFTSPPRITCPVVTNVSQATLEVGSKAKNSSSMASEIWSATLSGWPSETDSDENKYPIITELNVKQFC